MISVLPRARRAMLLILVLALSFALVAQAGRASADVFTVNSTSDSTECANTCTLRGTLREASSVSPGSSDTILLPAGTFELGKFEEAHPTSTGQLRLANPAGTTVTIRGAGVGATIVNAAQHDRVLRVGGGGSVVLEGLTLEGGFPEGNEKDNTLEESVRGGGIYQLGGELALDRVRLTADLNNGFGGAVDVENHGVLKLVDSEVDLDTTGVGGGGGVSVEPGTLEAIDTTFAMDNSGSGEGGAVQLLAHSTGTFINDTLANNGHNFSDTYEGGGVYMYEASASFTNVTFAGDGAFGTGGGGADIDANEVSKVTFTNTLLGSPAGGEPGELACATFESAKGPVSWKDEGGTLGGDSSCQLPPADSGRALDLGEPGANGGPTETVPLRKGSPAIDFGVPGCPETDQRGYSRVGACDSGAIEYGGIPPSKGEEAPSPSPGSPSPGSSGTSTTPNNALVGSTQTATASTAGVATAPAAVEALLLGCGKSQLVLNDAYIHGGRVLLSGSAAKSLIGEKVEILFNERKRVATAIVGANGSFTTTAPLPPAKIREALRTRYSAEIGKLRSLHLKLTRRLQLEPPKALGTTVMLTGTVTPPLTKPITPVVVEQQLECGKITIAKTFTPPANGRFQITLAVPASAKAVIYTLKSKVAANAHATKHGFTTYSLPLPVPLG